MKTILRFLAIPALASALAASAGDITGTVTLSGTPPPEKVIDQVKDNADCNKLHADAPMKTRFYVVWPKGGLAGVVLTLKGAAGGPAGEAAAPAVLDQAGCEYTPYIIAIQTNQKLSVKNSDPVMHNVHPTPKAPGNKEDNKAQFPNGADVSFKFPTAESFLRFKCDVHPWMFAYVTVVDSPYFAVSDKDGAFKIANVPPGKYTIEAIHRKASEGKPVTKEIEVKADGATIDFTLEVPKS